MVGPDISDHKFLMLSLQITIKTLMHRTVAQPQLHTQLQKERMKLLQQEQREGQG